MDITSLGSQWYFWLILVIIIGFIIYSGLKKRKKDNIERKKREKEVKDLIKKTVKKQDKLSNVAVEYLDVRPRAGGEYKNRDVYDVFVDIKEPKKNLIITKKAYEIEGFAKLKKSDDKSDDSEDVIVEWIINREFNFNEHKETINKIAPSKFSIFLKSFFKKNRQKYIQKQMKIYQKLTNKQKKIYKSESKKEKNEVFRPKFQKKEKDERF